MVNEFRKFVEENNLFTKDDTILLAVSGGIDSIVLCEMFRLNNYSFAMAHCNFHLRGEESNRDEAFVTDYAKRNNITLHKIEFDTHAYMKETGKSLQMSARELRYDWFYQLLKEHNYSFVATGHHADDSIETFFVNLIRGTGIAGLHGILQKVNNVIHPLLFTNRQRIVEFANQNNIQHVEDSTNALTKYTRNKIRHEIIPLIKEISPNFDRTILKEIERFKETEEVFRTVVNKVKEDIIEKNGKYLKISIEKLKSLNPQKIFIYEILSEFNFNEATIYSIQDCLNEASSGKKFYSETHRAIKDREYLFIAENCKECETEHFIEEDQNNISCPINLQFEFLRDLSFVNIPKSKDIAMFDADKLKFPLKLRKWQNGDYFIPYGFKGEKKISDFYTNLKYSLLDKENQWLLCSGDDIIWVIGQRTDDRYKITNKTKTIYRIEFNE